MQDQNFLNFLMAGVQILGGLFLKVVWDAVKDLQAADRDIALKGGAVELLVAGEYVKKQDFEQLAKALFAKLDKIDDKLDGKMSKQDCERHGK